MQKVTHLLSAREPVALCKHTNKTFLVYMFQRQVEDFLVGEIIGRVGNAS
jgi:hypothetical protein